MDASVDPPWPGFFSIAPRAGRCTLRLDDYLRLEFAGQHPGWEPRFGKATRFDPAVDRYDYMYLLHGNVPEAKTHEEAEKKVRELLDEIAHGLKSVRPAIEKAIPRPLVRVWRWH